MSTRRNLRGTAGFEPDDNISSYRPEADGRNAAGENVQYLPLRDLHDPSRQTRLVDDRESDNELMDDMEANGLLHPPVVRPHPTLTRAWEIVAGHRRIRRARRLAEAGRGRRFLREPLDGAEPGDWRMPVLVQGLTDLEAHNRTIAENLVRRDLKAWEQARALFERQQLLEAQGAPHSVRDLAAAIGLKRGTIGAYVMVARAISAEVIAASLPGGSEVDDPDAVLCRLSLEALTRAARPNDPRARARILRLECSQAGIVPRLAGEAAPATDPLPMEGGGGASQGLQVNIRRPIAELSPERARRYLVRLVPAAVALAERVGVEPMGVALNHLRAALVALQKQDGSG